MKATFQVAFYWQLVTCIDVKKIANLLLKLSMANSTSIQDTFKRIYDKISGLQNKGLYELNKYSYPKISDTHPIELTLSNYADGKLLTKSELAEGLLVSTALNRESGGLSIMYSSQLIKAGYGVALFLHTESEFPAQIINTANIFGRSKDVVVISHKNASEFDEGSIEELIRKRAIIIITTDANHFHRRVDHPEAFKELEFLVKRYTTTLATIDSSPDHASLFNTSFFVNLNLHHCIKELNNTLKRVGAGRIILDPKELIELSIIEIGKELAHWQLFGSLTGVHSKSRANLTTGEFLLYSYGERQHEKPKIASLLRTRYRVTNPEINELLTID